MRKVKCDERHPECLRCASTGRKCDGYNTVAPGSYSWDHLLQPQRSISPVIGASREASELRGLAFFSRIVVPTLEGPLRGSSWSRTVLQASHSEPAVRHAALAISALLENFGRPQTTLAANDIAIRHYNSAIKHLVASDAPSLDIVLLVCILFVCTEFLRGDAAAAITHVVHGMSLLRSSGPSSDLASVFQHLSIFPHFFSQDTANIPPPTESTSNVLRELSQTPSEAHESLNLLLHRTIRLIRMADRHRLGAEVDAEVDLGFLKSVTSIQQCLEKDLHLWWYTFSGVLIDSTFQTEHETYSLSLLLEAQWLVAKTWSGACLETNEISYDAQKPNFERIIHLAALAKARGAVSGTNGAKFSFFMGFSPLLYFVVLKCRFLSMRLNALSLMMSLSCLREGMWDRATMIATARRIIEIEHEIDLSEDETKSGQSASMDLSSVPRDEQRIRDNMLEDDVQVYQDDHGKQVTKRKIRFLVKGESGRIEATCDWITLPPDLSQI